MTARKKTPPQPKPIRLTRASRKALVEYAKTLISCPKEETNEKVALEEFRAVVGEVLDIHFPMRDMKVLATYNRTWTPDTLEIGVCDDNGNENGSLRRAVAFADCLFVHSHRRFTTTTPRGKIQREAGYALKALTDRDVQLPVPIGREVPINTGRVFASEEETVKLMNAFHDWKAALEKHYAMRQQKINDYNALIAITETWEDLEAVWPECVTIKAQNVDQPVALVRYDPDLPKRIRRDVEERRKAATEVS